MLDLRGIVGQWEESEMSIVEYRREKGLGYHNFLYWKKGVKGHDTCGKFIRCKPAMPVFSPQGICELVLSGGSRMVFYQEPRVEFIKSLLA